MEGGVSLEAGGWVEIKTQQSIGVGQVGSSGLVVKELFVESTEIKSEAAGGLTG